MMELTKPPKNPAGRSVDPLSGGGDDEEEAPGGIANMRVVNASKVMGMLLTLFRFGCLPSKVELNTW